MRHRDWDITSKLTLHGVNSLEPIHALTFEPLVNVPHLPSNKAIECRVENTNPLVTTETEEEKVKCGRGEHFFSYLMIYINNALGRGSRAG